MEDGMGEELRRACQTFWDDAQRTAVQPRDRRMHIERVPHPLDDVPGGGLVQRDTDRVGVHDPYVDVLPAGARRDLRPPVRHVDGDRVQAPAGADFAPYTLAAVG